MGRSKKEPFTFNSNLEKITEKIHEKPYKVLAIIGGNLVREIRNTTMKSQFHQRYKILSKSTKNTGLQWAYGYSGGKRDNSELQIGFKMSIPGLVGDMITGKEQDPIKPVVVKNAQVIQDMIAVALDEIRKE